MATSDLHAHLVGWDYDTDRAVPGHGLARVAGLVQVARAEHENNMLFDNGDFLNGSPLGDHSAAVPRLSRRHPMIAAMNVLNYDAATLGNHEFSEGMYHLSRALAGARFPIVATNFRPKQGGDFVPPFLILERIFKDEFDRPQPLKIGVIGFMPPQTRLWEADHLQDRFLIGDIVTEARRVLPQLRACGAEIVVALAHSGMQSGGHSGDGENVAQALSELSEIDAVFAGHIHETYPAQRICAATSHDAPVAMPGLFGSHLAVIDLELRFDKARWNVVAYSSEARPVAARHPQNGQIRPLIKEMAQLKILARRAHAILRTEGQAQIGTTPHRLHSYFALLQPSSALALVASAQRDHLAAALAGGRYADVPILSAVAPYKAGGRGGPENFTDIPAGRLARRHVHDLYLHPNYLVAFRLTGAELVEWLERSVSLFNQINPRTKAQRLVNPMFPGFNFDVVHGLEYQIDLTKPARYDEYGHRTESTAHRICGAMLEGVPLSPTAPVILASNSFRMAGGGGFPASEPKNAVYRSNSQMRAIIQDHICAGRAGDVLAGGWGFVPIKHAGVIIETSPLAEGLLAEIAQFRPESLGWQANGFHGFHLWL